MDALKKVTGGGSSGSNNTQQTQGGQKDDYGDKGAAYLNKKYAGDKLSHDQLEKVTDGVREQFEKTTGKNVPDKISN